MRVLPKNEHKVTRYGTAARRISFMDAGRKTETHRRTHTKTTPLQEQDKIFDRIWTRKIRHARETQAHEEQLHQHHEWN